MNRELLVEMLFWFLMGFVATQLIRWIDAIIKFFFHR